tara:strand:- start:322 stop:681 length:360 start_codon:yes stop_codon:yes gene_type:complete
VKSKHSFNFPKRGGEIPPQLFNFLQGQIKMRISVRNMTSNSGNPVANQFVIRTKDFRIFQSYSTTIAKILNSGKVFLDVDYWDYSRTTGKYRNQFLNENIAETRKKINNGEYILKDLNK